MTQPISPLTTAVLTSLDHLPPPPARSGEYPGSGLPSTVDPSVPYPPITPLLTLRARRLLHHLAELTCTEPDALAGFVLERALQVECTILEEIAQTPDDGPAVPGLPGYGGHYDAAAELDLGNEAIMEKLTHEGTLTD